MLVAQPAHDPWQQHVGHALERPDVDPAGLAGLEPLDRLGRGLRLGEDLAGVGEHHLAERRDAHRPRPARTVEHGAADRPLERGDLLADRALRVAESLGGAAERPLEGDRVECEEMAQLEARERSRGPPDRG